MKITLRPYARLLTMLGEQLIRNERIALVELVKNSYDADATSVNIHFVNFSEDGTAKKDSHIEIVDNGYGMSTGTVEDHWMNPATSSKAVAKRSSARTPLGRTIQGEKGIGRFAMFKLGAEVELTTREPRSDTETTVQLDISFLDEETPASLPQAGENVPLDASTAFLDEVQADLQVGPPAHFRGNDHGTRLVIKKLRSKWGRPAIDAVIDDLHRLTPLKGLLTGQVGFQLADFQVTYLLNGSIYRGPESPEAGIQELLRHAVLKVLATFDSASQTFTLLVNDRERTIPLNSREVREKLIYRRRFGTSGTDQPLELTCGSFSAEFAVFDLDASADAEHKLGSDEKAIIRQHRIYLYRDGVRVMPYGNPDDDWLQLDVIRGTQGANRILGNDQTIGIVEITQEDNSGLRDKTNREGLIDAGPPFQDFIFALQTILTILRTKDYDAYQTAVQRRRNAKAELDRTALDKDFAALRAALVENPRAAKTLQRAERRLKAEREYLIRRAQRTDQLAGVGLSVESAAHDVISVANKAVEVSGALRHGVEQELGSAHYLATLSRQVSEAVGFVADRLQDVQGIFVSTRGKVADVEVLSVARKVGRIYTRLLRKNDIELSISGDGDVTWRVAEGVLLQVLLNLVDNACYWLIASGQSRPRVSIALAPDGNALLVTDNGPGIAPEDQSLIYEPFYSTKGEEGRGLGLYIASEIAARNRLKLSLHSTSKEGTTFVLERSESVK